MSGPRSIGYIVVVESDTLMREVLERWLGEAGYRVAFWSVGSRTASPPGSRGGPRLLIADVSVPRLAQEKIRDCQSAWAAPILLISGRFRRGVGESRHVADSLGVRRVLPKPFTRAELFAAVEASTERTR